jgi:hypothetical protein
MTVFESKKIVLGKNIQKFRMSCSMKNYEQGNNAIRKRHQTLFKDKKDHYYSFGPSDELLQTLPFEFVANLKGGVYTRLLSNGWVIFDQNSISHKEIQLHQYVLWEVQGHPIIYLAFFCWLFNLTKRVATYTKYSWRSHFFCEPWTNTWNHRW